MSNIYFQKNYQRSFGTYPLNGKILADALGEGLKVGYRSVDTAQMYENEEDVGAVLSVCGIPRKEICLTTKVQLDNCVEERFINSVKESLKKLKTDYVDVLLLHWPNQHGKNNEALQLLEESYKQGLTRNIGLSNYTAQMMRDAKKTVGVPLVTNQVEFHPLLNQDILLAASVETGIPLSSYCSVARGKVFEETIINELAEKYGKVPSQIVLQWILQKGVSINTMSTKPNNIKNNYHVNDFCLSNVDMAEIDKLTKKDYRIVNKSLVPWAPKWD